MIKRIYCDYNASTPVLEEVKHSFLDAMALFGNSSSLHQSGREAKSALEAARAVLAESISAEPDQVLFCGSGSEANNQVLKSLLLQQRDRGPVHVLVSAIEHSSVLETVAYLSSWGVEVEHVPVDEQGLLNLDALQAMLKPHTALVSVMLANNETGSIQDIATIAAIVHEHGALLHCDAVQALGKLAVNIKDVPVDFMSFSAHKLGAPKGVGGLFVHDDECLQPLLHGGKHERALRASTENIPGIVAFSKAVECIDVTAYQRHTAALKTIFMKGLKEMPGVYVNGPKNKMCLSNTLNVSFEGCDGHALAMNCDLAGIDVSTGSACSVGSIEPSHVLEAMGLSRELNLSSLRFSFGMANTKQEIERIVLVLSETVERLRGL